MNSAVYLVMEPIGIIASDLALNVQDYDPSATVLVALSPDAACELLQDHAAVSVAFVHADPNTFVMTKFARALESRGAQLVFSGDAAERNGCEVLVLHRPFCAQTTAALLQRTHRSEIV